MIHQRQLTSLFEISKTLQNGANYQRQGDRRVIEDFCESSTLVGWHEFSPRYCFCVGAPAESTPMHWFGTNPNTIVVALQRQFFVAASRHQLGIYTELLRPVSWDAAADGKNAHALCREHSVREPLEILEGVESQYRTLPLLPRDLVQCKVDTQLGI